MNLSRQDELLPTNILHQYEQNKLNSIVQITKQSNNNNTESTENKIVDQHIHIPFSIILVPTFNINLNLENCKSNNKYLVANVLTNNPKTNILEYSYQCITVELIYCTHSQGILDIHNYSIFVIYNNKRISITWKRKLELNNSKLNQNKNNTTVNYPQPQFECECTQISNTGKDYTYSICTRIEPTKTNTVSINPDFCILTSSTPS